jgi:hypothetical protein
MIRVALMLGFDTQGRNQLQGKIVGTKKWIGTSGMELSKGIAAGQQEGLTRNETSGFRKDIYAAMVAKGVP